MSRANQVYIFTLTSGQMMEFNTPNGYWKILTSTGTVDVRRDGGSLLKGLSAGQGEQVEFNRLQVTDSSGASNTVQLLLADSTFVDTRTVGSMSVTANPRTTFTQSQNTVGAASANLAAANSNRSYLLIQNNGTIAIYVNLTGAACTVANGLSIAAGGSLELGSGVPTTAVTAITAAGNNTNVILVEG